MDVLRGCNIHFTRHNLSTVCSTCRLGKAHKLPFNSSNTLYSLPFELVEIDVWGPAHLNSNRFVYYVSFVDMHSRYTWVYFIQSKPKLSSPAHGKQNPWILKTEQFDTKMNM